MYFPDHSQCDMRAETRSTTQVCFCLSSVHEMCMHVHAYSVFQAFMRPYAGG